MIEFLNTLGGERQPFSPLVPGRVRMYTCGPTVYDFAHIGNFRAYVFEDLLKRFLRFAGYEVVHVMNITDVDDKTIAGANAKGLSLRDYTERYIRSFFEDLAILNIAPADHYPRATEHVPEMIRIIEVLLEKGYAYRQDGSIYFSIARFPEYGKLSRIKAEDLRATDRVEADEYGKESARDFALWKAAKEGEPVWETAIGSGRPGWHIECSAMSSKYLGQPFDIHCGGVDNIFPHHENEIAQSEAFSGKPLATTWLHCHHLIINGEKMSKSKGNYFTLKDLLAQKVDPLALRYLLLSTHYRRILNFTFEALDQAAAALQRIQDFLYELETTSFPPGRGETFPPLIEDTRTKFAEGLGQDLNISLALTALFELIKKMNVLIKNGDVRAEDAREAVAFVRSLDGVLAVLPAKKEGDLPDDLRKKIDAREQARKARDFRLADAIRGELAEAGVLLEDTKDGVRWKLVKKAG